MQESLDGIRNITQNVLPHIPGHLQRPVIEAIQRERHYLHVMENQLDESEIRAARRRVERAVNDVMGGERMVREGGAGSRIREREGGGMMDDNMGYNKYGRKPEWWEEKVAFGRYL